MFLSLRLVATNHHCRDRHVIADTPLRRLLQDGIREFGHAQEILHHGLCKLVEAESGPCPISHQKDEVSVVSAELLYERLNPSASEFLFACAFSKDAGLAVPK